MHKDNKSTNTVRRIGAMALTGILCLGAAGNDNLPFFLQAAHAAEAENKERAAGSDGAFVSDPEESILEETTESVVDEETTDSPLENGTQDTEEKPIENPQDIPEENTNSTGEENSDNSGTQNTKPGKPSDGDTDKQNNGNTAENSSPANEQNSQKQPVSDAENEQDTLTEEEEQELKEEEELAGEEEDNGEGNEALIAQQTIIRLPEIEEDFRFWTVERVYGFAAEKLTFYEEKNENSRKVGELKKDGLLYVLQTQEDGWYYAESGDVRGFIREDQVLTGQKAQPLLIQYQQKAKDLAARRSREYTGIEHAVSLAVPLIDKTENQAYTYIRATVCQTVADKVYALVQADRVNIREEQSTEGRIVGKLSKDSLCYILADQDSDWVFAESGTVRGFVKKEYLNIADEENQLAQEIKDNGEENYATAEEIIAPAENKALYYTLKSIHSGSQQSSLRSELLTYAAQFAGNPYRWGGSSLTEGTDCSGFAKAIYAKFGYRLPRTSRAQSQCGTKIAVEDARPGDLIFYAKNGKVYHVAIYAGNGRTIEAANEKLGITSLNAFRKNAVWAVHLLSDDREIPQESSIAAENTTEQEQGESLGEYHITYYCPCEACSDTAGTLQKDPSPLVEGYTVAVSPLTAQEGEQLIINSHLYTVIHRDDLRENEASIYVSSHEKTTQLAETDTQLYKKK